jgi:hypothetical protein
MRSLLVGFDFIYATGDGLVLKVGSMNGCLCGSLIIRESRFTRVPKFCTCFLKNFYGDMPPIAASGL